MMKFTANSPAGRFGEAYPVGNGQMGAVVYGSFPVEKITITENTFFSGSRSRENNQPGADRAFREMRELLRRGEYEAAHRAAKGFQGVRHNYGTNLPAGDVRITFRKDNGTIREYQRCLDYGCGLVQTEFQAADSRIRTELFASHPDHVLVWHMESEDTLDVSVQWMPYHGNGGRTGTETGFFYSAKAIEDVHCDEPCGVSLYGSCEALTDGRRIWSDGEMYISGAKEITLYLHCGTDYLNLMKEHPEEDLEAEKNIRAALKQKSAALLQQTYQTIKKRHMADVKNLMSRVELKLDGDAQKAAEMFQYGRYLLLSSSREDSRLPAHLQGIWNDDVACRIGWTCDMHLDINTQMNYWPADVTGLSEVLPPLAHWLENLAESGRRSAKESYGLPGWIAELVSNAWCYSAPYWTTAISPYPTGGVWLLSGLWDHVDYTEDEGFLKETVYPLTQEAVRFFADYVFETEEGILSCGPSISAENSFIVNGKSYQISNGCTYEIMMIRELFQRYLEFSCKVRPDEGLVKKVRELLPKLPPFRIREDGTLAEWEHDFPARDPQHRHTSHLLGLFPFSQITPEETPKLARAASASIRAKLTPYEQWEDTGWARSLLVLYAARLHDGEQAWFHVKSMMNELSEPNGMIYHPPTRGTVFEDDFGHVYELDGNTGLTSGIAEMLLQSHGGTIRLLPALPKEWENGYVKGLRARGGIQVEMCWEKGRITEFGLFSEKNKDCTVLYEEITECIALKTGKEYRRKVGS
ncbi:MAG: glycoside hydrolase family 95 protein [Eubacteriales bacterium]|nr:glycoside hydrolase family 95 protein [Eubacteriales bacterium]